MKINFEQAVNNTPKVKKAKTLSTELIAKEYDEHLKLGPKARSYNSMASLG